MDSYLIGGRLMDNVRLCSPCLHRHVVADTVGQRRFSEGEPFDDIRVNFVCLDCGEVLIESDRGTWCAESHQVEANLLVEEDEDDEF